MSPRHAIVPALLFATTACSQHASESTTDPAAAEDVDPPPADPKGALDDPYLWLEDVTAERSLTWARGQNSISTQELEAISGFLAMRDRLKAIRDSKDKIPYVKKRGSYYYNMWNDADHPRGLWRRTTLQEYRKAAPTWEIVLDIDALGKAEDESWVWKGADCLYPNYDRCLLLLSRGGADATVVREFDMATKSFVAGGFTVPEAKTDVAWKDRDTIYIGTDFGPGSLTESGYPRISKEWKRGTPLSDASTIFEGERTDVSAGVVRQWDHGKVRDLAYRGTTFFTNKRYLHHASGFEPLQKPDDATLKFWDDQVMITLRTAWAIDEHTYPAGALLVGDADAFQTGSREFDVLFTPSPTTSLAGVEALKTVILVNELDDVHNKLFVWKRGPKGWSRTPVKTPALASFGAWAVDEDESDDYWFNRSDFLTPSTLELQQGRAGRQVIKRAPSLFDESGLQVTQHFVTSKDGTRVPYFQVARNEPALDGNNPTLISGYGGFEISLTPGYSATTGAAWLERGGILVVPNIRGGGEYGPRWHQAALKHNRQRAYDDFAAVAEDLIARKVTQPSKLGIRGGSNGGLLVGAMMTQRPELFGAVVCAVPLLDMKRYHLLLAGASWMAEYGDPEDPEDWAALAKYSPYQNVWADVTYPRVLFTTSTRDDRVHPGHARKMAARMLEQGHDLLYYENIEGGHGGAADSGQAAYLDTLAYVFLAKELGIVQ